MTASAWVPEHDFRSIPVVLNAMVRTTLIILAAVALAFAGIVEGVLTNRWGPSEADSEVAKRIDAIPYKFGNWEGVDDSTKEDPTTAKLMKVAQATSWFLRVYTHKPSGKTLSVMLLCGPSGPISDHTPDVCGRGEGYSLVGRKERHTVLDPSGSTASFWAGRFERQGITGSGYRTWWAWGNDGEWTASEDPHREFVMRRLLLKLYVTQRIQTGSPDSEDAGMIQKFLLEFVPVAKNSLSPGAS